MLRQGSVDYDAAAKAYKVTGSGDNVWGTADGFHFVWTKVSGDISLSADIAFATKTGEEHKKAMLMCRQSLDADSAYADIAAHVSGLTSLQSREAKGAATHEVQANVAAIPKRLQLVKRGSYFYLFLAADGEAPHFAGPAMKVELQEPFYIGIGVSAHNKDNIETAVFSNVTLAPISTAGRGTLYSTIETATVQSTDRRVAYAAAGRFEAPNWLRDNTLIFNGGGRLLRMPSDGSAQPTPIDTQSLSRINNDHVPTPDGAWIGVSDQTEPGGSRIYLAAPSGGEPRRITPNAPSYLHGISPDGRTLIYTAQRDGKFDIYSIPFEGGAETRLTTAASLSDGPEYSPDGKDVYFNSDRSGTMQIWRMKSDGGDPEQITPEDGFHNWFGHVSPDGSRIAFVTFNKDVPAGEHPADKEITIRVMTLASKRISVLTRLFGGEGTMNVNSWSPDGRKLAFVSYQYIP